MSKNIGRYVGSEYYRTAEFDSEELVREMEKDLFSSSFVEDLSPADYRIFLKESFDESVSVNVSVELFEDLSKVEKAQYKEAIWNILGKYNFNRGGRLEEYNNQRFFEGDIDFW